MNYQQLFDDTMMREGWRNIYITWLREKFEAEQVVVPPGFVEALAEHLLRKEKGEFVWEDGQDDSTTVNLEFTSRDASQLERLAKDFEERIPEIVDGASLQVAEILLKSLRRSWKRESRKHVADERGFNRRLRKYWGDAFSLLRLLVQSSFEMGCELQQRQAVRAPYAAWPHVLMRLHARSCQIAREVIVLIESGYADGAMARWRTIYEINVVATVIREGGDALAERYIAHDAVEAKCELEHRLQTHEAMGMPKPDDEEIRIIHEDYDASVKRFGASFGKPFGWAADHLNLTRVTFKDLEQAADRSHMRAIYKFASFHVHADTPGIFRKLGTLEDTDVMLAGPSNVGLAMPAIHTAVSLLQTTALFPGNHDDVLEQAIHLRVLIGLRDALVKAFEQAEASVVRAHKEHLRKAL